MRLQSNWSRRWKALLSAAVLGLTATGVQAQTPRTDSPPKPLASVEVPAPSDAHGPVVPSEVESSFGEGDLFGGVWHGAIYSSNTAVSFIDSAIPFTQVRVHYDAYYDVNRPDRAEFFYPNVSGPPKGENHLDYQELSTSLEYAPWERFSVFMEIPVRFLNPDINANATGVSDLNFGFKYALLMDPCRVVTFQLRASTPTGDPNTGLGNDQWSLEPGFLFFRKFYDKWVLEAEVRDWIPLVDDHGFAGNIVRYGAGLSYHAYRGPSCRVTPVTEVIGWTVLGGKETLSDGTVMGTCGDTIVNLNVGLRIGFGDLCAPGELNQSDWYIGYSRSLTRDVWYENGLRVELRVRF